MTDTEKTSNTTAAVLKEEMRWNNKANKTPTILEVLEFKADLIEGLKECTYRGNEEGHTFLIETEEELRERTKDKTAEATERPKPPKEPKEPSDMEDDKLWDRFERMELIYKRNVKRYELAQEYDKQIKKLLIEAFPGCENYHLEGGTHLLKHITGKTILQTLMERAKLSEASRNSGRVIYNRFGDGPTGHTYKPNANGPSAFFHAIDKDLKLAKELEEDTINYKVAMKKSKEAFWKCGHEKNDLNRLELEWESELKTKTYATEELKYEAYKTFYTKELMKLFIYKPMTQEKAYSMEDIKSYVRDEMDDLNDQYNELATAFHTAQSRTADIPALIDTSTKDTSGLTESKHTALELKVEEQNSMLNSKIDNLMALIQNQNSGQRTQQQYNSYHNRPRSWRQLNKYCWSHGVCGHNSKACKARKPNHKQEATYTNRMGGSPKGLDNWKKWQSPQGDIHASKGDE